MCRRVALVFLSLWLVGTLLGALATAPDQTSTVVECDEQYETCNF